MARILISDHLSERREILCTFLRAEEHVIVPVARDAEAIKSLREMRPDLIILEGTVVGTKVRAERRELDCAIFMIVVLALAPSVGQLEEMVKLGLAHVL